MTENNAPAGWYDTPSGRRYWTGEAWAQHAAYTEGDHVAGKLERPIVARRPINKVLHLTLSIVTLGAWIPIWTLILLSRLSDERA